MGEALMLLSVWSPARLADSSSTAVGRMFFRILGAIAEFERARPTAARTQMQRLPSS
jgi:DNA invertase Pin-like site-specific DNA recombinase